MNADIFVALCDLLEKEIPELRWIDEDEGQLNTLPGNRPAVDYPCCLIDIHYPRCEDSTETEQMVTVSITLKLAFQPTGETNSRAPREVRSRALGRFAMADKVHCCLQGWTAGETLSPLSRRSARSSVTADKMKVYTIVYDTTFDEY